ncbi:hypothetical protein JQ616_01355 [Bradyrhizobium tropiciagri]|uniref:hypothetical protein n=1 Tax=Bradyrhizobium tropiciagri TaxID=312253 RepID=UPI001BAD64FA|nr:hypothetical protein [Bradyrhizobium tropiciagri]MBR0893579.1 hypothetical protein [Bradyrhizobium tropiciagri]
MLYFVMPGLVPGIDAYLAGFAMARMAGTLSAARVCPAMTGRGQPPRTGGIST